MQGATNPVRRHAGGVLRVRESCVHEPRVLATSTLASVRSASSLRIMSRRREEEVTMAKSENKKKPVRRRASDEDAGTARLVLRLPSSISEGLELGPRNQRDFSPLREVLDRWARRAKPLKVASDPPKQVCFHVNAETEVALREEAERLTEETGQAWTVSMVVARLWEEFKTQRS